VLFNYEWFKGKEQSINGVVFHIEKLVQFCYVGRLLHYIDKCISFERTFETIILECLNLFFPSSVLYLYEGKTVYQTV